MAITAACNGLFLKIKAKRNPKAKQSKALAPPKRTKDQKPKLTRKPSQKKKQIKKSSQKRNKNKRDKKTSHWQAFTIRSNVILK